MPNGAFNELSMIRLIFSKQTTYNGKFKQETRSGNPVDDNINPHEHFIEFRIIFDQTTKNDSVKALC